jgi:NADPH-dependent 2,4-dienoyl-CoA reductase/sulfur reductase-like enzyme
LNSIVVVGASLAGLRCVEMLRREGFEGRITLLGAEPHLPYDRPPLSKEFLAGDKAPAALALRTAPYEELDVDLRLGVAATSLDQHARTVRLDDDSEFGYDALVVATGAAPRTLPGLPELDGVLVLRTLDDAVALRTRLDRGRRVCVIGAGFIGAEVAASCRSLDLDVTLLEALPQPMVRGVGEVIGARLARLHREHGVDVRTSVRITGLQGASRVTAVELADGDPVPCDVVLVAVGVAPETSWLDDSGLTIDNGVVCDEYLTAAAGVLAAGDVARWPNPLFDRELMRVEHWTNAAEQGAYAAQRLMRGDDCEPFTTVPFVWSDQYDVKIQSAGRFGGDDRMEIVHGTLDDERFVALFERSGRVSGVLAFSQPRRLMQYRRMIAERATFDAALEFAAAQ